EADDHEVHRLDPCRERRHPSALAATLVTDAPRALASQAPGFVHRGDRIVGEQQVVLRVIAAGRAGTTLVVDEHADAFRRKLALQWIEFTRREMLRAVHQHDDRHARIALWHHQAPGQAHARAVEAGVGDVQRDAPAGNAVEGDAAVPAIEVHALAVVAPGPAERARPGVSGAPRELAGGAVEATPAQVVV